MKTESEVLNKIKQCKKAKKDLPRGDNLFRIQYEAMIDMLTWVLK